jgi:hypothetical protein
MLYSEEYGHWYVNQPRANGDTSAGVAIIDAALDGSDAAAPALLWSSIQFTIDNGFDGDTSAAQPDPNNDLFRRVRDISISPDGKYLVLHKNGADSCGGCGLGDGAVYLVPLDANGIPDINVEGGLITNVINIETLGDNGAHNSGAQVEWDAAGNLYVANSAVSTASADPLLTGQLIQVFSPGGNWIATTKSDGTFAVVPFVPGLLGDFNEDDKVDAADYVIWRKNETANVALPNDNGLATQAERFDLWRANFGNMTMPGGGSGGAVPEPATLVMLIVGMAAVALGRRRS